MNAHTNLARYSSGEFIRASDLDAMFAGYVAEAEASHAAFLAITERRHRAVLNECNVAIEDARETARATLIEIEGKVL